MGILTDWFIENLEGDYKRSNDPIFSVICSGGMSEQFSKIETNSSFGEGSFFDKFSKASGKLVNFNKDAGSTFLHYVEKCLNVPYRMDKVLPVYPLKMALLRIWSGHTFVVTSLINITFPNL